MDGVVLSCDEAEILIASATLNQTLSTSEQTQLRSHVAGCESCKQAWHEFSSVATRIPLTLEPVDPHPRLRAKIMAAVYAENGQPAKTRPSFASRMRGFLPSPRVASLVGTAAAVAVVAFVGARATAPAAHPAALISVGVAGTTSEPSAHGTLLYDAASQTSVLSLTGLPIPSDSPGKSAPVYEVWLVRSGHTPQGVAFLSRAPSGSTWSATWTGDLHNYGTLAATLEPAGGSAAPTSAELVQASLSI